MTHQNPTSPANATAWKIELGRLAAKLSAWAIRASDIRLVHHDTTGRETELERYQLAAGGEADLAATIARDLEQDASTYPSSQRYHLIAYLEDGGVLGQMRFQLEGTLVLSASLAGRVLEGPTEAGQIAQLQRHLENKEGSIKDLLGLVREVVSQGYASLRAQLEHYEAQHTAYVKAQFENREQETAGKIAEIRELEEQTRKNAQYTDLRSGVQFLLGKVAGGDPTVTTSTVDRLMASLTQEQIETLQGTFSEEQLRALITLKDGAKARAEERAKKDAAGGVNGSAKSGEAS